MKRVLHSNFSNREIIDLHKKKKIVRAKFFEHKIVNIFAYDSQIIEQHSLTLMFLSNA